MDALSKGVSILFGPINLPQSFLDLPKSAIGEHQDDDNTCRCVIRILSNRRVVCKTHKMMIACREASIKLRNFKARYLTMKLTIREYSCLGKFGTMTLNHFDFVVFKCAIFPKHEYSRMVSFIVK